MNKVIRMLPEKVVSKRDKDIRVETSHIFVDGLQHVFLVRCSYGGVVHEATMTLGATDGPRPEPYSVEQLQGELDKFREQHADECAWKHHLNSISETIV